MEFREKYIALNAWGEKEEKKKIKEISIQLKRGFIKANSAFLEKTNLQTSCKFYPAKKQRHKNIKNDKGNKY